MTGTTSTLAVAWQCLCLVSWANTSLSPSTEQDTVVSPVWVVEARLELEELQVTEEALAPPRLCCTWCWEAVRGSQGRKLSLGWRLSLGTTSSLAEAETGVERRHSPAPSSLAVTCTVPGFRGTAVI